MLCMGRKVRMVGPYGGDRGVADVVQSTACRWTMSSWIASVSIPELHSGVGVGFWEGGNNQPGTPVDPPPGTDANKGKWLTQPPDMCHAKYFALLEKKRFLSPIGENPQKILDLGCGTGMLSVVLALGYTRVRLVPRRTRCGGILGAACVQRLGGAAAVVCRWQFVGGWLVVLLQGGGLGVAAPGGDAG